MTRLDLNPPRFLMYIFAIQAVAVIALLFDIPFVRQISGFIFLTFVPGLVILKLGRIERSNVTETILFAVGLSIAFLMLLGFLVNALGTINLISEPLSTKPLFVAINLAVTLMSISIFLTNKEDSNVLNVKGTNFWLILLCIILPIISVIGVLFVNLFNSNVLLIILLSLIPIIFVVSLFKSNLSSYFPLIVISIALTLLLSTTLVSMYMYGDDINFEFNVFSSTQSMSYWDSQNFNDFDQFSSISMLSVTILPTLFSNLLNIDGGWVFKIIFPIIFSLLCLALYELYQIQWGKKVAFASIIFFMSNYVFFQLLITNGKQMIGELFYVLLFLVILRDNANSEKNNWFLVIMFMFGLVVSHYGMNYIFLVVIFISWIFGKIWLKSINTKISTSLVWFSLSLTFLWGIYITYAPFVKIVGIFQTFFTTFFEQFFDLGARGEPIQTALGLLESPSTLHFLGRLLQNVVMFLVVIGFFVMILKWRKGKLDSTYGLLVSINMGLILAAIIIPNFAGFLEMGRLYQVGLLFISPLFVIGAESLLKIALKLRKVKTEQYSLALISILLVAFFLFQTGFVYEIADDPVPSSISISKYKLGDSFNLIYESDAFGARWLSNYGDIGHVRTYADTLSVTHVLTSYSTLNRSMELLISNSTEQIRYSGIMYGKLYDVSLDTFYIFLSQFNVKTGMAVYNLNINLQYNITETPLLFNSTEVINNKIYSNGASEIYYQLPK